MTPSKLINKAVEEFDKNYPTLFICCDAEVKQEVKSFLTKCIQESYKAGREEEHQKLLDILEHNKDPMTGLYDYDGIALEVISLVKHEK